MSVESCGIVWRVYYDRESSIEERGRRNNGHIPFLNISSPMYEASMRMMQQPITTKNHQSGQNAQKIRFKNTREKKKFEASHCVWCFLPNKTHAPFL